MNRIFKLFALVLAVVGLASCEKHNNTPVQNDTAERTVIYTVGDQEVHRTVKSDNEWDALLESFCDYAMTGEQVAFYSLGEHSSVASKEPPSITTSDRNELKRWMKAMEKEGKTVVISFDDRTGKWNGKAYLTMPIVHEDNNCYTGVLTCVEMSIDDYGMIVTALVPALKINDDTLLVLEKYGYTMLCGYDFESGDTMTLCGTVETRQSYDNTEYLVLNLSSVSENAIAKEWVLTSMESNYTTAQNVGNLFDFGTDGTVTRTDGSSTESGTWSIDADGNLSCSLLPESGWWNINWISPQTMIISYLNNTNYITIEFESHNN